VKKISIFFFVEEGQGCDSEDIKNECNVNCLIFSVFLMDIMGGKITINLQELH